MGKWNRDLFSIKLINDSMKAIRTDKEINFRKLLFKLSTITLYQAACDYQFFGRVILFVTAKFQYFVNGLLHS